MLYFLDRITVHSWDTRWHSCTFVLWSMNISLWFFVLLLLPLCCLSSLFKL
jgi:hypothetical protein